MINSSTDSANIYLEEKWSFAPDYSWYSASNAKAWPDNIPSHTKTLTLFAAQPFVIPETLKDLNELTSLTLELNKLDMALPACLYRMTQLEELLISGAKVNFLALSKLCNLKKIYVIDCRSEDTPQVVTGASSLSHRCISVIQVKRLKNLICNRKCL